MAEVAAQLPWRRARAGADRGNHGIATLGIICPLRRPRDEACRHCALGRGADETLMSHYIFGRRWPLTTAALAVLALSGRVMPRAAAAPLITGGRLALLLPSAQILTASRAVRLSPVAWPTDPNGDPAAPAVKLPKLRLHLHAPRGTGQRRGEAGYKGPAASPHRRTATPGARGQSGIGTRALALCAVKDNERDHRHHVRGRSATASGEISTRRRQTRSAAARPPRKAAVYGRPSRPSHRMIRISSKRWRSRRLGATTPAPPQPRPRILPGFYPARPSGGLLLPSTGGLILDSAPGKAIGCCRRAKFFSFSACRRAQAGCI